ncbi:kinetochore scaffold 1 [Orycteropus afer afer]|uniref:Kinetochore scaffold 1 n=1 Tax=Orycteropus afer afer TaxID=1230840 RepID=A0AC54ZA31_ORYAF|nr:kinetochore scaffold 1 [Orycteropus afer afer]
MKNLLMNVKGYSRQIFQSESNMKILKRSEIAEKEERENVLLMQNKNPEDNHCEITGMNTLLCAPIQIQMQQREFSIIEHNHGRKYGNDQTIISSDENQMDLTASHTVMIAKGVLDCTKSDKSIKIDTKSFLASLKFHTEDSKLKKELNVSMDQNTSPEKKINFSDLIKRLKVGKSKASPSKESDKENCELSVHAKESNNACSVNQIHLNVDENSSNRTRIFREQEDEMNFTQCHIANIQTLVPISNEASLREVKSNDITICGSDFMDLTINHTVQILPSANNLSEIEDQTQNVRMDVTTGYRAKSPGKKKNFENEWNATFQDSILNPENEIHITKSHITGVETHTVTQTCNQDVKSLAMISESVCTNLTVPDKKTVFSSSCSNAIELTKCLSSMTEEKNLLKHDSNYSKICPNSDAISLLEEKTFYSGEDSMDITKSHTVAIDNQIFKQDETNVQIAATPISEGGMMLQNHVTVAEDGKMDINCSSVPYVSKERLQRSLANSSSISLTDRKTKLFTNEDMNLNKCHTGNLGSQTPLASGNLAQENTRKCHFPSKSSSDEWEKMTKNHTEPSPQRIVVSENLTTTLGNEKDQVLKISHCLDKDFPQSVGCNQNIAKTHNIISSRDLDKQVALGNNRNTVSCEQSLFSATKPLFSSEGQSFVKNHNTTVNSRTVVSVPGENSKLPEPLRKSLGSPTPNCSHDKMIICSVEEQNMDLTKSHTVVIGFGPSEVHDIGKTNLESTNSQLTTISRQIADKFRECNKSPIKKPGVFISNDTEVLEDKTLQKSRFLNEKQNVKTWGRKSIGRLKIDKTILFSETDENDMDITRSYTVEINHRPLLDKHDSHLMPLAGTSETVLDTYGQDEMEMTRSHTTALEYKPVSPDEVTTRPIDKTVMFVDNHNDLEMTESHTVFIDYQAKEKTGFPVRPNFELPKIKNLGKPEVASTPDEKSVFFPDDGENDHPAAKGIQLSLPGEWSSSGSVEKAVTSIADDNMKVFKPMAWKNDRDTQKPVFLNEPQSGKSQRRKSLGLKNDKTLAFSENDKNDIDITQSCVVEINNKSALEDREDSHLVKTSKTVLYTCGQDDMEMTRSHTTALECKPVSPDEVTTRPIDKTVMFVGNHNDLEVTKSHTVFIDCQAMEKLLQECPNFGTTEGNNLGVSFPKNDSSVQEITKKQALAIENKIIPHGEQLYHMVPFVLTNTLSGDQDEMESKKFHSTAVNEEVLEKIVDRTCTLGKAKMESYRIDRRNTDFMSSPATVTCRSSDNYSCLPNAVSFVDNLEGNIMSLCGKEKEKASNCTVLNELPYANNLAAEYYLKSEELPISVPFPLLEKAEVTQTNGKGQLDCVITLPKDQDNLVKKPQNTLANRTLVGSQDLGEMTRLNSKQVSFKLPNDQMEDFVDNAERSLKIFVDVGVSQPHLSTQLPPLTQEGQNVVNKDETILSEAGYKNLDIVTGNSSVTTYENESTMLNNEEQFTIPYKKELKENVPTAKCGTDTDVRSNSDLTKQVSQTHANLREPSDTVSTSNAPSFSSTKPNLNNLNGKTEDVLDFQIVHIPPPPEQLLDLANQAPIMSTMQATDKHNSDVVSSNASSNNRNEENKNSDNGAEINSVPLMTIGKEKNKMRKCSLGIFLPRLPNKRNCSVTGVDDLEQNPANTTDLNHLETQPVFSKDSGIGFVAAKLNLSPSQYINEENLPIYPEINSSDSISIETEEKTLIETYQKEILPSANEAEETWTTQKRTWVQEEDDDTQNEKKIRKNEIRLSNTAQDQQIFDHHTEGDIDKNANSILMKSLSRTPSSCSSSLDSIKADGTSLDFSTHRNSQMESQFLRDTICEESLREKLKNGRITIREFFILLQVHILIQKPRQSNLPTKFTINTPPTPEDLMLSQYVYRPKIQIYKEDCEALCQKIEELKLSALNQDKLLIDVNKNLWEKMRHCSEEELKTFGIYLNKIKSRFTKITKVFTHQGKVALYSKLVQSAQNERKKLQERIHAIDSILKKIDNCLTKVEIETKYLEDEKKENPMREWDSEMKAAEKDLEQLKTEEEELQRNLLELAVQKKQTLAQIDIVQKQTNRTEELLDQLSLSEWDVIEWSDDQAVFTFLYDTIELTITFGEAEVGLPFLNKDYRKIADLNFQSVLDEDKAPPSSLLVHKLIFQYIKEQDSWKKKCTTQHQVPKMLQEISLVVSHCRLLGEEIEFLKRWGPNYNLMNIDVNNTELRLLFSSSAAFAKFEIMLSLSAQYPSVPLPFSIQNHLGNIGQDEIAAILFNVPLEDNYLKNVVKHISQDLLQDCRFHQ